MRRMKFRCELLSDIVLSQSSSSEGNQKCLDFIPGNNFLGIAANTLYKEESADTLDLFHSGKVRFGDAHPSKGNIRGLKVPAAMFYPKLKKASEELYIHHCIENQKQLKDLQLKQCREGFYAFSENTGKPIDVRKGVTIKSAYDANARRSKDGQMFGYEYLAKGLVLYFEIESELEDTINDKIVNALKGERHIGHSRTAEFGQVMITPLTDSDVYQEPASSSQPIEINSKKYAVVYADGRLIFLRPDNSEPTCQPTAKDLGISGGAIVWEKSQIRTFQYAPWNGKRQSYDADRYGVEKGSVLVVELTPDAHCPAESQYVGAYTNEGFGRVIYNPQFLLPEAGKNGKTTYLLEEPAKPQKKDPETVTSTKPLLAYLQAQQDATSARKTAYGIVENAVKEFDPLFSKGQFASQWGSIRSIAMITPDSDQLITNVKTFLTHGVAAEKWAGVRQKQLEQFMNENKDEGLQDIMINLASEMAKRCRKED